MSSILAMADGDSSLERSVMHIHRVVIRNIKGFSNADLDLTADEMAGWTVITGDNGAGKTALLRAVAIAILGPDQSQGLVQDLRGWVREGQQSGTISVEVEPHHDVDRTYRGGNPVQGTFWAEIEISHDVEAPQVRGSVAWAIRSTDVFRKKKRGAFNGPWAPSTLGWFILGYGPFRRMYGSSPDAQRLMVIPGRIPHFATLFKEDATLAEGEEWIKQLSFKRLEERKHETIALENLLKLMGDEFLRSEVSIERADSEGLWLRDSNGMLMTLADMSEGYRSSLAMLIDIYRHMVDVFGPEDLVEQVQGRYVVTQPGVVMIDEVDAHLHPAWQRRLGFWMKEHFPRVQFIVTTHSPIVCQAADGGRIFHLPDLESETEPFRLSELDFYRVISGKPDEILLSPAFEMGHTRSPKAVAARKRRAQLRARQLQFGELSELENSEFEQLSLFTVSGDDGEPD